MTGTYTYTPEIWLPLAIAIFLAALSLYSWRHRSIPAARSLAASSLFGALWMLGIAIEVATVAPGAKITWHKFQAAWQLPAATAMVCFALEYAHPGRWLTRRNLTLLALPPLLIMLLIASNSAPLIRLEIAPDGLVARQFGTLGTIMLVYGLGLGLVNTAAFLWLFIRSPQHRWPVALILFGDIAGRGLYGLHVLNAAPLSSLTLPNAFAASLLLDWIMYAIALFGFRILDPLPAARKVAIAQMREGMVVFDAQWRVASLNPAAASMVSTSAAHARGKTLAELLPDFADLSERMADTAPDAVEINLGTGEEARCYALNASLLKDFRGLPIGRLLLLRDVTERRQAQAQVLEHQWARAILQEREQLAHELHDGLSQSLAFLNLQAQTTQVYLRAGQGEAAQNSLARLAEVSREMQDDMRELIGNLLAVMLPSEGFCSALRQAVARFEGQTGLAIALEIVGDVEAACDPAILSPAKGVQLLRILQEALTNVRKHAGAPSQVNVQLRAESGQVYLTIADTGRGFDPELPDPAGKHFGLQVMRQRAARIGGQIAIHSGRDEGTRVEVCVPLTSDKKGTRYEDSPG